MATEHSESGAAGLDALRFRDGQGQRQAVTEQVELLGERTVAVTFVPVTRGELNEFDAITENPDRPEDFDRFNRAAYRYVLGRYFPDYRNADVDPPAYLRDSVAAQVDGWPPEDFDAGIIPADLDSVIAQWFRTSGVDLLADALDGDASDTLDQVQQIIDEQNEGN